VTSQEVTHDKEKLENTSSTMLQCARLSQMYPLARRLRVGISYYNRLTGGTEHEEIWSPYQQVDRSTSPMETAVSLCSSLPSSSAVRVPDGGPN
jgi:hypothetical protein